MQFVEVCIEFPSGLSIIDRCTYAPDIGMVYISVRLRDFLAIVGQSESPPTITASWDGNEATLIQSTADSFAVIELWASPAVQRTWLSSRLIRSTWSKDQRQQYGRVCHALTVSAIVGIVGYANSAPGWTFQMARNIAAMIVVAVITFIVGMDSMNGD
ncbi:hypothetical protein C7H84_34045 [Burkholderia sp. Nafp2/4-1b]|uniref:hypothetical protein n=1 Tax=Burkholderia sp. Nafp2/4-1b TaxID=2116686 RepID=UPI000EF90E5B|nr:hypothetical protein [Burkholderia sp. Nafp2/4-1b]RKT98944.1 hypothetical protein C7H84_34045 [Burkholderia sp. Nafp2/4-1b]